MKLFDLVDETLYREMLEQGYIRQNTHPYLPMFTVGYTEKAQFDRKWNEVTINCRGLIVDVGLRILARPWKKFFNVGEGDILFGMNDRIEVTDKMDGSLGILYPLYDGRMNEALDGMAYAIATRGSFESDQAIHATRIWQDKYALHMDGPALAMMKEYTFLFEIVYPDNRIVLDYGELDDLVLLGAVNIEYGYYHGPLEAAALLNWDGPMTPVFSYQTMQEVVNAPDRLNAEGVVMRSGNKMLKLKQTDYIELHRLISNLSEKSVWQGLRDGKTAEEICETLPDEFHGFVKETAEKITNQFVELALEVNKEFMDVMHSFNIPAGQLVSRKDFAFAVAMSPYRKYMFNLFDDKRIVEMLFDDIKPKGETNARI